MISDISQALASYIAEAPDDTVIWRYMKLGPFLEMLMNSTLFQLRVDAFEDRSEGAYGYDNIRITERTAAILRQEPNVVSDAEGMHTLDFEPADLIEAAQLQTVLTCWWSYPKHESFGMWHVYGGDTFAVAIETTVGALRQVFDGNSQAVVGAVAYTKLPQRPAEIDNVHTLFFHKRQEYEDEREIRSVHVLPTKAPEKAFEQALTPSNLDNLLKNVITAPGMRPRMIDTIRDTIQTKFSRIDLKFESDRLRQSTLDKELLPRRR